MKSGNWMTSVVLPLAVAAMSMQAVAQDDFFGLDELPDEEKASVYHANEIEAGIGYLDSDAFAFGRYTGLTDSGFEPVINFRLQSRPEWDDDNARYWHFEGRRLGWDSPWLRLEAGEQGVQRVTVGYRANTKNMFGDARTPYLGAGGSFLGLPPGWAADGNSTADLPALEENLRTIEIGQKRRRLELGYQREFKSRWSLEVDTRREMRDGTRSVGAAFGSTGGNPRAVILPAPVDHVTNIIDTTIRYNGDRFNAGLSYHGSFFRNQQSSMTWQHPFGAHPQWGAGTAFPDALGRMSLEPDNTFHQLQLSGNYRVSDKTRMSANLAVGRMTQDEPFLPYTINQLLDTSVPLPRNSLDGRIDTTVINLRITSQPVNRLNLVASYRYDDRDNRTPRDAYQYVAGDVTDQVSPDDARINLPYSYREHRVDSTATFRLAGGTRLVAGYSYRDLERDFSETKGSSEWTTRIGLRASPGESFSFSADYRRSARDTDPYDGAAPLVASHVPGTIGPDAFENHPLLRKFYLHDRDRDQFTMRGDFFPAPGLNFGLATSYAKDDYGRGNFGLNEAKVRSVSFDTGFSPSAGLVATAWYTHERYDSDQTGRAFRPGQAFDPDRDWLVDTADKIDSFGLGLERKGAGERASVAGTVDLGVDIVHSRTRSEMDVTGGPALTVAPLPELKTRINAYRAYARYHLSDTASLRLGYEHERFSSRDYALDGVEPDTLGNVLGLGNASPNYSVNWVTVVYRYRF